MSGNSPEKKGRTKVLSARFDDSEYADIKSIAEANRTTISNALYEIVKGDLGKYIKSDSNLSHEEAAALHEAAVKIYNELEEIRHELQKQGVNLNQIARCRNAYLKGKISYAEMKSIMDHEPSLTKDDIDNLLSKFDELTREVGDVRWLPN